MAIDIMRRRIVGSIGSAAVMLAPSAVCMSARAGHAHELHFSSLVLVSHSDTPQRLLYKGFDLARRDPEGHVDIPRMREGGLNAVFFSIYIDAGIYGSRAVQLALDQIDAVHETVRANGTLQFCRSANDIRSARKAGRIAVLIGIEGGQMIGDDIRILRAFGDLGVRYMSLTHTQNNEWADSSNERPIHGGLTDAGKSVIREMNKRGILVDISHVSDKVFYDALAVSTAPLIASHSSCRALVNHPRNMSDQMIRDLASKGGVIQINFEKTYLDQAYCEAYDTVLGNVFTGTDDIMKACGSDNDCYWRENIRLEARLTAEDKLPHVTWGRIVEHIDHVVRLVGSQYVGLGADFDGASMPEGMEDCSKLPRITEALVARGYSDVDIRGILGGNVIRVMEQSEHVRGASAPRSG